MVEVRIFGGLWKHLAPRMELDLEGHNVRVADLIAHLDIDPSEIGIVTVDGRQSSLEKPVPTDSRVCIFPPMLGG
jgi:sulfur carrier protein ThiS